MADARRTAVVARDLAELEAKLVSLTSVKVIRDGETVRESMRMVRKWERISDRFRADYEAYLRGQEWLTDPMADQEKRTGRWRVLRVYSSPEKTNPSEQGIYQMLLYWPEDYGDFGEYCAESSPLAHTDVEIFHDSPELADCAHEIKVGTVFSATNRLDPETGLWSGEKREDISREYGSGLSSVSGGPLVAVTETERRNAEAPPTGRLTTPGQSRRISWSINRYGKIDYQKTTRVDKPFDTGLVATGGDSLKTEQSQIKLNQDSVTVSSIEGKVVSAGISVGESGLINARITQITPIAADSGWISYQDRYGLSYFRSFKNQDFVPTDGFTKETSNSLSAIKNEFGLWDGTASRSAVRDDSGGSSTEDDVEVYYTIDINGTSYEISEKITGSLSRAQTHISGTNTGGSGKNPGIVYIGHGKYKATKVIVKVIVSP